MTKEEHQALVNLAHSIHAIRRAAEGQYVPYELAAAIERADQSQADCWPIIEDLRASITGSGEEV